MAQEALHSLNSDIQMDKDCTPRFRSQVSTFQLDMQSTNFGQALKKFQHDIFEVHLKYQSTRAQGDS